MKILYLNHPEADYGGAFLYNGLCKILGSSNVIDFPPKMSYHGQEHKYSTPSIKNGSTCPFQWMPGYPCWSDQPLDVDACLQAVRSMLIDGVFDATVVEAPRYGALLAYNTLESLIRRKPMPVVLHDGEDGDHLDRGAIQNVRPDILLKRELLSAFGHCPRNYGGVLVEPFPFSFPFDREESNLLVKDAHGQERTVDVTFMAGRTHDFRQEVADALHNATDLTACVGIQPDMSRSAQNTNLLPWYEYLALLGRSKLGVSTRGFGYDTCRYWEVPAYTVLLAQRLPTQIPNPFVHETDCIEFSTPSECAELARIWRSRMDDLARMYTAGSAKLFQYHTNRARAQRVLTLIQEVRNG